MTMAPRHLRRAQRRRDRGRVRAAGGRERLGDVDHAPAPQCHEQVALDGVQQIARHLVDAPGRRVVHGSGSGDDRRRGLLGPRRRDQHVAVVEQVWRLGQGAAPEAHEPLAVAPGEVAGHGGQHAKRQPPAQAILTSRKGSAGSLAVRVTLSALTPVSHDAPPDAPLGDLHARTALVALALVREAPGAAAGGALVRALRERPAADAAALIADADADGAADARTLSHGAIAVCAQEPDRAGWVVPTIAEQFPAALSLQEDGVTWALLPARALDDAGRSTTEAALRVAARLGVRTAVGLSPFVTGPERLRHALRQARIVLELVRRGEVDVHEATTGTWRLLLALAVCDPGELAARVATGVGPALDHDARLRTEVVPTFRAYLEHGANMNATAAAIYAHRHTVAARLERLGALTRLDPMRHDDRERLGLGVKARLVLDALAEVR